MSAVDDLGMLRQEIAALKKEETSLRALLTESGETDGKFFEATYQESKRKTINWQKIAVRYEPSKQLIAANTTVKSIVAVVVKQKPISII